MHMYKFQLVVILKNNSLSPLSIGSSIAYLYTFHCTKKKSFLPKYKEIAPFHPTSVETVKPNGNRFNLSIQNTRKRSCAGSQSMGQ